MPGSDPGLRRLRLESDGVSPGIVRLSVGDLPHKAFEFRCETPYKLDAGGRAPEGPEFVCLWECGDAVEGYWRKRDRIEFIRFDIESPESYSVISESQQGLLARVFMDLIEWERDDLEGAAQAVGFLHLDKLIEFDQSSPGMEYGRLVEARSRFFRSLTD